MKKFKVVITEDNGNKRIIGEYDKENKIFITHREGEKHLFRKYNAWAVDKKVVEMLQKEGNPLIVIIDVKNKVRYEISTKDFIKYANEIQYYEHRKQLYVPKEKFRRVSI